MKPCIQDRLREFAKRKNTNLLIVIILLILSISGGFYFFSYENFGSNLLSEIVGIIVTYYIIGWLLDKKEEKKYSPYKKALLNHIQYQCYIILLCILGEDLSLVTGDNLNWDEQTEKSRNELEEYYYDGKDIISTETATLLYEIIGSVRTYLFFSNLREHSKSVEEELSFARKIKALFEIIESPDRFLGVADDAINRLIIRIESQQTLDSMFKR